MAAFSNFSRSNLTKPLRRSLVKTTELPFRQFRWIKYLDFLIQTLLIVLSIYGTFIYEGSWYDWTNILSLIGGTIGITVWQTSSAIIAIRWSVPWPKIRTVFLIVLAGNLLVSPSLYFCFGPPFLTIMVLSHFSFLFLYYLLTCVWCLKKNVFD